MVLREPVARGAGIVYLEGVTAAEIDRWDEKARLARDNLPEEDKLKRMRADALAAAPEHGTVESRGPGPRP